MKPHVVFWNNDKLDIIFHYVNLANMNLNLTAPTMLPHVRKRNPCSRWKDRAYLNHPLTFVRNQKFLCSPSANYGNSHRKDFWNTVRMFVF